MTTAAAAQAELMEKEKHIVEIQNRVQMMKSQIQTMANHQGALEREKKRCLITNTELGTCSADHNVYRGVGRMFVKHSVEDMINIHKDRETKCGEEATRLANEKKRLIDTYQREEVQLQQLVKDYMTTVQLLQAEFEKKK
eukprot:Tbor_TRINITY_DN2672_c0_g2::TRINITY_DN2672_c0_g2_i2::g.17906::m.17906/K09548/PFDN1; prefoldin subunit 1